MVAWSGAAGSASAALPAAVLLGPPMNGTGTGAVRFRTMVLA
jgi:hypothetical protein